MNYNVSHIPDTANFLNFKVRNTEGKEVIFNFCKETFLVWGKPSVLRLKEVMVAYVKRNGWTAKSPVEINLANSSRNINTFVKSLNESKAKK